MAMKFQKATNNATVAEKAGVVLAVLGLPAVLGWTMVTSPFVQHNKAKPWRRICGDTAFRYLTSTLNVAQLLFASGSTLDVYKTWAKQQNLPVVVEELGEDARLLWIGPIRNDRVILYCHGGAYLASMQPCTPSFFKYVKEQLNEKDVDVGLAILSYSLVPAADFPTQLKQARLGLMHLIDSGVKPQNIQLAGDSAGGNLVLELISHILHPLEDVPPIVLSEPLRGAYLMSPWVSLSADSPSHTENDRFDSIGHDAIYYWGSNVLAGVPDAQRNYIEASKAPEDWFKGVDAVVNRVLITGGDAECLRDDIIAFESKFAKHLDDVTFYLQKGGLHIDPCLDFLLNERTKMCEITPQIVDWFAEGFSKR